MTERPDEDPTPDFQAFGVSMPVPSSLAALMQEAHRSTEMAEMSRASQRLRIYGFLDGLSKDQLQVLRFVLNQETGLLQYIDGMVASILRLTHGLDPETGEPINPEALLEPKEAGDRERSE